MRVQLIAACQQSPDNNNNNNNNHHHPGSRQLKNVLPECPSGDKVLFVRIPRRQRRPQNTAVPAQRHHKLAVPLTGHARCNVVTAAAHDLSPAKQQKRMAGQALPGTCSKAHHTPQPGHMLASSTFLSLAASRSLASSAAASRPWAFSWGAEPMMAPRFWAAAGAGFSSGACRADRACTSATAVFVAAARNGCQPGHGLC